jgi:hypothetical protein
MRRVRSGSHLELIGDTYYYRRAVPRDAHHVFGKRVVRKTLGTSNLTEAKRLEKQHDVDFEIQLRDAREIGPDGYPKDDNQRIAGFIDKVLNGKDGTPGYMTRALAEIPERDRKEVSDIIGFLAEEGKRFDYEMELFWKKELIDLIVWSENPEEWKVTRAEIVQLLKTYNTDAATVHTIDWAYEQWLGGKHRPQQTQDEAKRYLDDFKATAQVRLLSAVRRGHVLSWRKALQDTGNLAPKSINHRLEIVSAILRTGWRDAEMQAPDLSRIGVPEPVTSGRTSWSRDDLMKALEALEPGSWSAWLFVIALTTGTRLGEPMAARKDWHDPLGYIHVPAEFTKMKKPHVLPLIDLVREPLAQHIGGLSADSYMFSAPRPAQKSLKISHEASKWFGRFFDRQGIDKVFHELRHTWVEAARVSPIKKEIHDIISGHAATTVSDKYGGAKPSELKAANEVVCHQFIDGEMASAIRRLLCA